MLRCKSLVGAVVVVLMVSLVSAQEQPRRGRGGGRGFGGGGMFGGPTALLRMPEVRKDLATTDEQNKEIDAALEQLPQPGGFGNFQDLSEEERQKAMEERRKKSEEVDAKVKKILKPQQVTRLDQLALQRQGADALMRPEIAKQLDLTEEQQEKLQKIQEEARAPGGAGGGGFQNFQNLSDEERQKLFADMQKRRDKTQADMLAVLTGEQKTKWAEMTGKKFDFPAFGGFGGGRPGGPGGAGGERRRPPTKE